jgi:hypothetical protein
VKSFSEDGGEDMSYTHETMPGKGGAPRITGSAMAFFFRKIPTRKII